LVFGDGKEVPQLAMAKFFKNRDFRSGYYRDQTFMMAIGQLTVQQFLPDWRKTQILNRTYVC
jgi:TPP-dependent pyruvate/acetoin dehydrogenase alpha subunit